MSRFSKPMPPCRNLRVVQRLLSKLDQQRGCWVWTGRLTPDGYGRIKVNGQATPTHRVAYAAFVGEIPEDTDIDHTCCRTACCNPYHLRPLHRVANVAKGNKTRHKLAT